MSLADFDKAAPVCEQRGLLLPLSLQYMLWGISHP